MILGYSIYHLVNDVYETKAVVKSNETGCIIGFSERQGTKEECVATLIKLVVSEIKEGTAEFYVTQAP